MKSRHSKLKWISKFFKGLNDHSPPQKNMIPARDPKQCGGEAKGNVYNVDDSVNVAADFDFDGDVVDDDDAAADDDDDDDDEGCDDDDDDGDDGDDNVDAADDDDDEEDDDVDVEEEEADDDVEEEDVEEKDRSQDREHTLCEPARSKCTRNGHFTRAILYGILQ